MRPISELRVLIDRIPYADGNIGEEAILTALLQDLQACGVTDIFLSSNMPERTKGRHGKKIGIIADKPSRWPLLPLEVAKADLVIWGGGHMLQDRSSRLYIPYVIKMLLLAKVLGAPRFIYAPGMGPVRTRMGRILSRWALKGAAAITVRDEASARFLESLGLAGSFQRTADPAFSLETSFDQPASRKPDSPPIIGFAPRRHFYRKGSALPVSWQLAAQNPNPRFEHLLQESAAALDFLVEKYGARIHLLALDIGPNPRDDLICHRLRNYMVHGNSAQVLDDDPSLDEWVQRLANLDLLISARLHGIILGLRFGLPFIGIDSDGKIEHFAQSIGLGDFALRDTELNRDRLCDLAARAFSDRNRLKKDLLRQGMLRKDLAKVNRARLKECLERIARGESH